MQSYRAALQRSWARSYTSVRDLAVSIPLSAPFTLQELVTKLGAVESVHHETSVHTSDSRPISGRLVFDLSSDGSYVVSGHMRATGLLSYDYGLQAWLTCPDGTIIAVPKSGSVYGFDTPGDRQENFSVEGRNTAITAQWGSLRLGAGVIEHRLHTEIGGVLGGAFDVIKFLGEGLATVAAVGPAGFVIVLGKELVEIGLIAGTPDILAALVVAGGTLWVLGPGGLVPAVILGGAAAEIMNIRHRAMQPLEINFARKVFVDHIDYGRIRLTDLSQAGDRKFVMPSVDGSILVNLGSAYDTPMGSSEQYPVPGSLFIHELTHAWQLTQRSLLSVISDMSEDYDYYDKARGRTGDLTWTTRGWDSFNNEEQAHIVDDWYSMNVVTDSDGKYQGRDGIPVTDLDGQKALLDPAYPFIRDHIRLGNP